MSKVSDQGAITGATKLEERVKRLEEQQAAWGNRFFNTFMIGRLRTDRTAPTSSTDVQTPDMIYDVVRQNVITTGVAYQYTLINNAGTLVWVRTIMSSW